MTGLRVGILGELEVTGDRGAVPVTGLRLRRLLTRLATDPSRVVSIAELVDAIWPDDPPADTANALQTLVSRLRRALGDPSVVQQTHGGYRLALPEHAVDSWEFVQAVRKGRDLLAAGDAEHARTVLVAALALWRGEALPDADGADYALPVRARLDQERLEALGARVDADLATGRAQAVVPELEDLARSYPMHERFTAQLMLALAQSGRSAAALAAYERLRETLAETLGADPSPALQEQHLAILRQVPQPGHDAATPIGRRPRLRAGLTSFLGRERDQARVLDLLEAGRMVTVLGPGGSGKTRLATEVGRYEQDVRSAPVALVELAPVKDPASVLQAFLAALDLRDTHLIDRTRERRRTDDLDLLVAALSTPGTLLVVDNCEHLLDVTARLVEELLTAVPDLRVLATSREPLGVDGEALCVLPPLALPPWDVTLDEATTYPSIQLFAERARAVQAGPVLTGESLPDVVEIVRRLDGLPLAIELAAARTRVLPVREVAVRLSDRFRLLTGGRRTALPRHQTLRAVVEWSWDLLDDDERLLAERLSVFPAGATADSAAIVCGDERLSAATVPGVLDALVDKSLLAVDVSQEDVRYRMLETIREYGADRLTERGEIEQARHRHADHYSALVVDLSRRLRGAEQVRSAHRLDAERDNVLGALRYLGDSGDAPNALSLALELSWYWSVIGNDAEVSQWVGFAAAVPDPLGRADPTERALAEAILTLSQLMDSRFADPDDLEARVAAASDRLEETLQGGADVRAEVMVMRVVLAMFSGRQDRARALVESGLADDDPWVRAAVRMFRASMAENQGDIDQMRVDAPAAIAEFSSLHDGWGLASALSIQAQVQTLDGDLTGAVRSYDEAGGYLAALGAKTDRALLAMRRGSVCIRMGDLEGARRDFALIDLADMDGFAQIFGVATRAWLAVAEQDRAAMVALRDELATGVDTDTMASTLRDHGLALVLGILGMLHLELGEELAAAEALARSYPAAVNTRDMAIVATVGVTVAQLAHHLGLHESAATVLGAAACVRGAEDPTDVLVAALTRVLPEALGLQAYEATYQQGLHLPRQEAMTRLDPAPLLAAAREQAAEKERDGVVPSDGGELAQARRR